MDRELWEQRLRFFVRDGRMHDHIISLLPIDRSSNTILVSQLERVDDADDLVLY